MYISFAHLAIIIFNKNYQPIERVNSFGTIYLYAIRNTFAKKMTNSSRTVCVMNEVKVLTGMTMTLIGCLSIFCFMSNMLVIHHNDDAY